VKVVIAGNPNAGKTTLFNSLTHSTYKTGNWHGVTTFSVQKKVKDITYVDVAGMYSFNAYSMEEATAAEDVLTADVIINVIDSLTLENSLTLTKNLIAGGRKVVVYLTKLNCLKARGGRVDVNLLQKYLGVPVMVCRPTDLKRAVENGSINFDVKRENVNFSDVYFGGSHSLKRVERLFYNKIFAPLFFVLSMVFAFFITFHPKMIGAIAKSWLQDLITITFSNVISKHITNDILRSFICDGIIAGAGGVLAFIPQIAILYLFLTLLDESGIMSALSFVTDGIFEKVNLSGRAAFSLISGFGCTAAAISTTRGYSSLSAQRRTIAILPYIPCGAKLPVFLTLLSPIFKNPFPAVCILYFCGVAMALLFSMLMSGGEEQLITEIAPIGVPSLTAVKNKLYFYVKGFIIKVTTTVTIFCAVSWVLSSFSWNFSYVSVEDSMLCSITKVIAPLFYPMGITDWRLCYAAICGFAAKENVAATINLFFPDGLNLSVAQSLSLCAFMLTCPACIAAFASSVKEIGRKSTLKYNVIQLAFSFIFAYIVYFIFLLL
jgi:ferrous iron transport protein B